MSKALLIQSYTTLNTGTQGEWNELNMANSYIQGIQTGDILGNVNAQTLSALISGVPSPWARAKLFKYALDTINNPNPNIDNGGLLNFYEILHGEWRGLLATIALYPDRIRFSAPVHMNVKGDDYGIASAFGRMLFDDKDVWSNQQELAKNPDAQPFVHLIYYRNQLVGGTSPLTGVFTGVNYSGLGDTASDINWYRNGKFEDPTRYLTPQQLQKVFLFIQNLNKNVAQFETMINSQRGGKKTINLSGFKGMARKWEQELTDKGNGLKKVGPVAQYGGLQEPFAGLFKSDVPVYLKPDFTFTYVNEGDYQTIGDIQELLSRDEYVVGWIEPKAQRPKLSDAPVYYLSFNDIQTGETFYFSVPLSEIGIDIFQNKFDTILGYSGNSNTRLSCHLTDAGMLSVSLVVEIDGESVTLNDREYNIHWVQNQGKVIAWPNFVSEKWNKYYLFSEFTDTDTEQFLPLYKTKGEILKTIDGQFLTSRYEPTPEEEKQVDIKKLVTFPSGQSDNLPKYNIIASNKPMCGLYAVVRVTGKTMGAGFLMMRQDVVKDLTSVDMNSPAVVGVDFGSNNTCLFYNANDRGARPMVFGNYRAVLVGRENNDKRAVAENNELLFFTNYPSENGQLKSWLHEHDSRYVGPNQSEEVAGGVPVNRPNVRVQEMNEFEIKTQAGTLHYNMKWLDNDKGNVIPLTLPNGEDRVWLFFHEDTANNRIVYGKTFEDNYRDKEPHYFGDIFPLIESDDNHFTRYDNRPEEMREIFKVANIFSHLHEAVQEQGKVDTYISFSADISDVARWKFLQELEEANFNVIESVARISHLGLEESKKRGVFTTPGMYLVLVATNDNMHFSLYKSVENLFVRVNESTLLGFGLDVRKRALIESVVENINRTTRFLSTSDEFAKEYKRQERFADEWLSQIANRRPGIPVSLPNITFAVAPNNPYTVPIKPIDLDQRTEGLVDEIVRKIADFVRSNNVQSHEIEGIVFIGNTFTNTKFSAAINSKFIVDENKLVKYREVELPKVVSVYAQIDCAQFKEATEDFVKDAKLQEELNRHAREEAARKEAAMVAAQEEQAKKDAALKSEKEYKNAIENVERYESEHDYENMREWAGIALTHHPDDEYAKEKQALAQQLLAEQRANNKHFSTILQRIKNAYSEGRWNDAISQSDMALEMRPDSEEVLRIKRDSKRQLDIKEKVTNFLNRADMFFAQKLYDEALEEVGKVLNLDSSNDEAKSIQRRISEVRSKQEEKVQEFVAKLRESEVANDFEAAIQICEVLIEEDVANLSKWTSKKERLISLRKEHDENKRKLAELKEDINKAHYDEDWTKLKLLCENYLSISSDNLVSQFLLKAKKTTGRNPRKRS